jgi:hypothetical protein
MMMKLNSTLLPFFAVVLLVLPQAYAGGPKKGKKGKKGGPPKHVETLEFKEELFKVLSPMAVGEVTTYDLPLKGMVPKMEKDKYGMMVPTKDGTMEMQKVGKIVGTCTSLDETAAYYYCDIIFSFDEKLGYFPKGQIATVGNMVPGPKSTGLVITGCTGEAYKECTGLVEVTGAGFYKVLLD